MAVLMTTHQVSAAPETSDLGNKEQLVHQSLATTNGTSGAIF